LHYALRQVLGSHAAQAGSKVDRDYLRFDFTHPEAVSESELERIEELVNERIREAAPVRCEWTSLDEAMRRGAIALFGEKYGQRVRMVSMGEFSRELCGGTHLENTGQVGLCKIVSEESVAAGTRRIVALTGPAALQHVREEERILKGLSQLIRAAPPELPQRVKATLEEVKKLKKQLSRRQEAAATVSVDQLIAAAKQAAGARVIAYELPEASPEHMRHMIDLVRRKAAPVAVLLATRNEQRVQLVAGLSRELVERGFSAADWVREVAKQLGGGGGGRPDMAQAGGRQPERLPEALAKAAEAMCRDIERKSQ